MGYLPYSTGEFIYGFLVAINPIISESQIVQEFCHSSPVSSQTCQLSLPNTAARSRPCGLAVIFSGGTSAAVNKSMSLFHCLLHVKPIYEVRDFCEGFFKVFLIGDIHEVVVFFDFSRIGFFFFRLEQIFSMVCLEARTVVRQFLDNESL